MWAEAVSLLKVSEQIYYEDIFIYYYYYQNTIYHRFSRVYVLESKIFPLLISFWGMRRQFFILESRGVRLGRRDVRFWDSYSNRMLNLTL